MNNELEKIKTRYSLRNERELSRRYQPNEPYIYMSKQEKERRLFLLFKLLKYHDLSNIKLLEIGCGRGEKILDLIQMGFSPERLMANELMSENIKIAGKRLPASVALLEGDATQLKIDKESLDVVYQSMVFSSILDDGFQQVLANSMWGWVKPGGGILWYDFVYNNPKNKDVRGVSVTRIKALFPDAKEFVTRKVTLAPPLSRVVTRIHPSFYAFLNLFPFLRTHVICFVKK